MGQRIVEDVMKIHWQITVNIFLAMFFCLIVIAMMRWVAKPLVWLSILGVIIMLGFGKIYTENVAEICLKIERYHALLIQFCVGFYFQEHIIPSSNMHI